MVCLRNICINTLHKGDSIFTYNHKVTVLWTPAVHTDREVTANRPDKKVKVKVIPLQAYGVQRVLGG
jgi:hypothetical protein